MLKKEVLDLRKFSVGKERVNFRLAQVFILSGMVISIASAVLLAWLIKIPILLSVFSGAPTMKFNAALCFVLSGLGLLAVVKKDKLLNVFGFSLALLAILIGSGSLLQYFIPVDLHLDDLFVQDPYPSTYPGRMARTTAVCFVLFGLSVITARSHQKIYRRIHKYALGFVALVSVMALFTYVLQGMTTTRVLVFNTMAIHTATSFFLLALAMSLVDRRNSYIDLISGVRVGSKVARKLLPFVVTMPLVLGVLVLYIVGSESISTEFGIALFTMIYASLGLMYTSWVSEKMNREDLQRKKLEHSLKLSSKELMENIRFKEKLVTTTPEYIFIISLSTLSIKYLNQDLFPEEKLKKERIEGMPLLSVLPYVHPRDRSKLTDLQRKLIKSSDDEVHDMEVRLKLKENKWEWFNVRGKVFQRPDGIWLEEYILLVRNITNQKENQKELLKARKFSIQGEIARTLAHELRNPIASIGMANEVLGKILDEAEKQKVQKYLEILDRSNHTLRELVDNLLNSSKYQVADLSTIDLTEVVESTIQKAADRIYLSGVEVVKKYSGSYHILADKEKLEIAILNILVNASEATIPDEGIIKVNITEEDSEVVLSIRDNGGGLEEEQVENLFEAFYTSKNTGIGVGLHSVKTIIEEHQARITVDSKPKKGTEFKIFFPKTS